MKNIETGNDEKVSVIAAVLIINNSKGEMVGVRLVDSLTGQHKDVGYKGVLQGISVGQEILNLRIRDKYIEFTGDVSKYPTAVIKDGIVGKPNAVRYTVLYETKDGRHCVSNADGKVETVNQQDYDNLKNNGFFTNLNDSNWIKKRDYVRSSEGSVDKGGAVYKFKIYDNCAMVPVLGYSITQEAVLDLTRNRKGITVIELQGGAAGLRITDRAAFDLAFITQLEKEVILRVYDELVLTKLIAGDKQFKSLRHVEYYGRLTGKSALSILKYLIKKSEALNEDAFKHIKFKNSECSDIASLSAEYLIDMYTDAADDSSKQSFIKGHASFLEAAADAGGEKIEALVQSLRRKYNTRFISYSECIDDAGISVISCDMKKMKQVEAEIKGICDTIDKITEKNSALYGLDDIKYTIMHEVELYIKSINSRIRYESTSIGKVTVTFYRRTENRLMTCLFIVMSDTSGWLKLMYDGVMPAAEYGDSAVLDALEKRDESIMRLECGSVGYRKNQMMLTTQFSAFIEKLRKSGSRDDGTWKPEDIAEIDTGMKKE